MNIQNKDNNNYIEYKYNNTILEAYISKPNDFNINNKYSAVLICHAWAGRDDFVKNIADKLAKLGYIAVALDVYGKDILGTSVEENTALMMPLIENRAELQNRLKAGFDKITNLEFINSNKIAAIGYCFGGLCVLDMARMGLDLTAVISIHGLFVKPDNLSNYKIKPKVLALHGHQDTMVKISDVNNFMSELDQAQACWQINTYGMAKHAFTNPQANDDDLGTVYNKLADDRSWEDICDFLQEVF